MKADGTEISAGETRRKEAAPGLAILNFTAGSATAANLAHSTIVMLFNFNDFIMHFLVDLISHAAFNNAFLSLNLLFLSNLHVQISLHLYK